MDRVKTGIPGFDELVEGGLPASFNILITGAPGTGKTIFGLQYLVQGVKNGENGIYVSLDTTRKQLLAQGSEFGWDLEAMEKDGKLIILEIPLDLPEVNIFSLVEETVEKIKAKRLVFDSLINFAINVDQFKIPLNYRVNSNMAAAMGNVDSQGRVLYQGKSRERITYLLINELSKLGTTNLVITAGVEGEGQITVDGVSEYACDGLIILKSLAIGDSVNRTIEIKKMRLTKIDGGIKSYDITSKGISLSKVEN